MKIKIHIYELSMMYNITSICKSDACNTSESINEAQRIKSLC